MARKSAIRPQSPPSTVLDELPEDCVWAGNDELRPLLRSIQELQPDAANVRSHPQRNLDTIRQSIGRFGQQRPVLIDPTGVVIAGNGLLEVARECGWTHLAAVRTDLPPDEAEAYGLVDNRSGELSEWDWQGLAAKLKDMEARSVAIDDLGWADFELDPLLAAQWKPPEPEPMDNDGGDSQGHQGGDQGRPIAVTPAQRKTIEAAIERAHQVQGQEDWTEGACVAWVCQQWIERG